MRLIIDNSFRYLLFLVKRITMKHITILFIFGAIISLNSCGSMKINRLMKIHHSALSEAANSTTMSAEDKLDVLGETFVGVINESLSYVHPKNTIKHFDQFAKQNEKEINTIMANVEEWQSDMGEVGQLMMIANMATKSYAKDLIRLVPKVEKKIDRSIKTIGFLSKFVNVLTPKF